MVNYQTAIESVRYFSKLSNKKDDSRVLYLQQNSNITFKTPKVYTYVDELAIKEEKNIAEFLLNPSGVQKWMDQINYLIIGRGDSQFNSHKSLIFMAMDKYKNHLCSQNYKDAIKRVYRQLMHLQFEGYLLWSKAQGIVHWDSSVLAIRYDDVLRKQKEYIEEATCSVNIPYSTNLQSCSGDGYVNYIHKSLDVQVTCKNGYVCKRYLE